MTVKHEVLQILAGSAEPMHSMAIHAKCKEASGRPIVAQTLSGLKNDGLVKPTGMGENMVLWTVTAAGRAALNEMNSADNKPEAGSSVPDRQERKPRRAAGKGKKPEKKKRRKGVRAKNRERNTPPAAPRRVIKVPATRWAITDDKKLLLMADGTIALEITRDFAEPLVDVIRRYGGEPFAALQVFVEKLDRAGV